MGFWTDAMDEMQTIVNDTWSDVSWNMREGLAGRINFRDAISAGNVATPLAILNIGPTRTEQWGLKNYIQLVDCEIWYIRGTTLTAGEVTNKTLLENFLAEQCQSLAAALRDHAYNTAAATFQLVEDPTIDAGPLNPANREFLEVNSPFVGGSVQFTMMVGETL